MRLNPYAFRTAVLFLLAPIALAIGGPQTLQAPQQGITPEEIQTYVDYLASDALLGRDAGQPGCDLAAEYIANQFEKYGLSKVGDGWKTEFAVPGVGASPTAELDILGTNGKTIQGPDAIQAMPYSAAGTFELTPTTDADKPTGKLVLIDDIADDKEARKRARELLKAGAKGVVFLEDTRVVRVPKSASDIRRRGGAGGEDNQMASLSDMSAFSDLPEGELTSLDDLPPDVRASIEDSMEQMGIPMDSGAVKVMVKSGSRVLQPGDPEWDGVESGEGGVADMPEGEITSLDDLPPEIRAQIEEQLAAQGISPDALTEGGDGETPAITSSKPIVTSKTMIGAPTLTGSRLRGPVVAVGSDVADKLRSAAKANRNVELHVAYQGREKSCNVLGKIEGSDPKLKDEYVVIGAHYDHVGADNQGNVWNGADDNASGTAAMMAIAKSLATSKERPKRSVIFAAWGAEEVGVMGSNHFMNNPPVPVDKIVAYVNLDMVGRNDPGKIGASAASKQLGEWAVEAAKPHGLEASDKEPWALYASDTMGFVSKKIPTVFYHSGLHPDYHTANDDPNTIDADKTARVAESARDLATRVANTEQRPDFTAPKGLGGMFSGLPSISGVDTEGRRILGVFPGEATKDGVEILSIFPNSAAAKAGMKPDDVLVRVGDRAIKTQRDILEAVEKLPAKEPFEIEVRRKGSDKPVILKGVFTK